MFIREIKKQNPNSDKAFIYHRLIESIRTPKGPRQKVVMNLGTLDLPKEKWKELANRIEQLVHGQDTTIFEIPSEIETLAHHYSQLLIKKRLDEKNQDQQIEQTRDFQSVDVNALFSSKNKTIGPEHVGYSSMKSMGLFELFKQLNFTQYQSELAALLIIGRLVHPGSERELSRYAREESALDELLGTNFSHLGHNALYRASDLLFENKDLIEKFLRKRNKEIFSLNETIILYDLTNTYFAGNAEGCKKAKRGRSKEKRNDRPLITLGLVIDEDGFVKGSRIFEGNVSEPSTLITMIHDIHKQTQKDTPPLLVPKPTVVIDAGIASEDNLKLLRKKKLSYIVVSRSKPKDILNDEFIEIKGGVKAQIIKQNDEIFLHCISQGKVKKENAMLVQARTRMEQELKKVCDGLNKKGCVKAYPKVLERIGRIRQRYTRVSQGFTITVTEHKGRATAIKWGFDKSKLSKPYDGSYFIRTDRTDLSMEEIWQTYVMLTSVEDAFRCLKSELGIRPNHHSKNDRIEGHLFISVLAYHLLQYVQRHMRDAGINHRWKTILSWLKMHEVISTSMLKEDGGMIHLRYCTIPTLIQKNIYKALGITSVPLKRKKSNA